MNNCQIKIKDIIYNIFTKPKNKKKKSFDTFKDNVRVVVWENESPVDSFDMFQGSNNIWTAWTANTMSETRIKLRLEIEEYLNDLMSKELSKEIEKEFDKMFSKDTITTITI